MMSVGCIESGFSNDEVLNNRFPLHRACRDGDVGTLCSLLQCATNQADLVAEDSFYGWTPIHWAAHFGKLECVLRLVQVGCEVNAVTTRFAQTPAHIAAFGGHPQCLMWLMQAGADINRQDYVGETPIHKAARAGSVECVTALLLNGAKPDLRNANGQTAADLAHAQGFQECAHLLATAQNQLNQLNGLQCSNGGATNGCNGMNGTNGSSGVNGFLNGGGSHQHQQQHHQALNGVANRKRVLDSSENNLFKKARTDDMDLSLQWASSSGSGSGSEESEGMSMEELSPQAACSGGATVTPSLNGHAQLQQPTQNTTTNELEHHHNPPLQNGHLASSSHTSGPSPPPSTHHQQHHSNPADMCGSLHQAGSPSSCVSHRPSWGAFNNDFGEPLHYGHYHGFGDTAEDFEDVAMVATNSSQEHSSSMKVEQRYNQALLSAMQLFHGS
ncbi:ankyrin repeat domain-containing protein 10a isoform X2 [Engraulis encrasicolus]|uniref:ankyrin repeat domain-containing protein 10a isoform X2 n=1 Tax=Engraulis encrasicolus TaxID=184585 RepID=UPI002FD204C2